MFDRLLDLLNTGSSSLFLWGPRQSGKSTLLKKYFKDAFWVDLLLTENYRKYSTRPERLREELRLNGVKVVVIDEVQKVPQLLNEVHWLIENMNIKFILCGSSARKLKRGHANLLGGRALRFELYGLTANELKEEFDLDKILQRGYLPQIYLHDFSEKALESYVADYLKEEIAAEALVKNLAPFSEFLELAALADTEMVSFMSFSRDCGVSSSSIKEYYQILSDTLLGEWLPAYKKRIKRRLTQKSKFYFFDVGVVNSLAKRKQIQPKSYDYGKAFENWVFHELRCFKSYTGKIDRISYWRLVSGIEVDFIIDDMRVAIEVKSSENITKQHLKSLRSLQDEYALEKGFEKIRRIVVCREKIGRRTDDGIEILPYKEFVKILWSGKL